jgi:hypothetical protein
MQLCWMVYDLAASWMFWLDEVPPFFYLSEIEKLIHPFMFMGEGIQVALRALKPVNLAAPMEYSVAYVWDRLHTMNRPLESPGGQ